MWLKVRFASVVGSLGIAMGCLIAIISFGVTLYSLALGTVLGWTIGFIIGYRAAAAIQQIESIARVERIISKSLNFDIIAGWALVVSGVIALLVGGWNLTLFVATFFFIVCSLYLMYYRSRNKQ